MWQILIFLWKKAPGGKEANRRIVSVWEKKMSEILLFIMYIELKSAKKDDL